MLMAEIGGTLRVVQPGATQPDATPFLTIPNAVATADAGTHDLTLDPNFATNHYVYVFYEHADGHLLSGHGFAVHRRRRPEQRLSRERARALAGRRPTTTGSHHGASLAFGPDGKLYISTGDNGQPPDSQSLTSYHGKILRINPDGTIPSDNPFVDGHWRQQGSDLGLRVPKPVPHDVPTGRPDGSTLATSAGTRMTRLSRSSTWSAWRQLRLAALRRRAVRVLPA